MELLVQPLNRPFAVELGSNLLEVLRANGLPISYSCLAGRCGTCRCRVLSGQVLDTGPESGRAQVGADHSVLACQAVLTESCSIELPEVDEVVVHPARILKGTVMAIEAPTADIRRLRIQTNKPLSFSPGQYASLQFTPEHIRPYSMAGLPEDDALEFHVREVPGGRVSEYVFKTLAVGDSVRISGPLGTSYLRRRHLGPMLCVAGGTGLAPVLSIVRGALAAGMDNPIALYFGVRSQADLYDWERLQALAQAHTNLRVHAVIATGPVPAGMRGGLLTDAVAQDLSDLQGWRAYFCGAPAMVEAVTWAAKRQGLAQAHIHADAFYPTGV